MFRLLILSLLCANSALGFTHAPPGLARHRVALSCSNIHDPREPQTRLDIKTLLKECRRRNDYTKAIELANYLETEQELTAMTATTIIRLYGEARQLGKAISVLSQMKSCDIEPNERHYGALIHATRKVGHWEMALQLFERMDSEGIRANTIVYNSMITVLGDAQKLELVEEYLQRMDSEKVAKDTYTYVLCYVLPSFLVHDGLFVSLIHLLLFVCIL
jgi:pentatricopeptide repeat protein